jgi:hypothetical protein
LPAAANRVGAARRPKMAEYSFLTTFLNLRLTKALLGMRESVMVDEELFEWRPI